MKYKNVQYLLPSQEVDMDGFPILQALPTERVQQVDPFLLLHHAKSIFDPNIPAKQHGVGPHPHRGFSPVTFVVEGAVHHRDSRGNNQIAHRGDVQWMNAGMGIIHSERPIQPQVDQGIHQEVIQLWVNTASSKKMMIPEYHFMPENSLPNYVTPDELTTIKVVAGELNGVNSRRFTSDELSILWGQSKRDGKLEFTPNPAHNAMLYVIKGALKLSGYGPIEAEQLAIFGKEGANVKMHFTDDTSFLWLGGKPIDEKVTQYGPFVMNTQTEIMQAMSDYKMGKMGILIED